MAQQEKGLEIELDIMRLLTNYFKELKRLWWIPAVLAVLVGGILAFVIKSTYVPAYEAKCTFTVKVVNKATTGEINSLYGFYYDKDLADQLEKTFTYILTSDLLNDEVQQILGEKMKEGQISSKCITGSNMFTLTAHGETPEDALALLEAVMQVYTEAARYIVGDMQVDMVEPPAAKNTPYNAPAQTRNLIIGGILGFALGSLAIVIPVWNKRTITKPQELEGLLNMPCLGLVPMVDGVGRADAEQTNFSGEFRESIRGIARKLESDMESNGAKVLLITSTLPGEGKSMLCQKLAQTLADWGKQVWLVDGDLRKPMLYKRFGIKDRQLPMELFLKGQIALEQISFCGESENLHVIGNTRAASQPTVLIDSKAMKDMIKTLRQQADYVIIDVPPCDTMSDVMLFQQYADRVLYVVRQDYAPVNRITDAVENLCANESKLLGYILNSTAKTARGYGKYGYGAYSYGKYGNGYYGKYGRYGKKNYEGYYTDSEKIHSEK